MSNWIRDPTATFKPVLVIISAPVIIGTILFTCLYLLSAIYVPSNSLHSSFYSFPRSNRTQQTQPVVPNNNPHTSTNTKTMPPLETFRLSRELVQQRVKDNIIIVTFGNFAYMEFTVNWVKYLTDLGLENFIVGAMDTEMLEALYWKGIPVYDMESHLSTVVAAWGSPLFNKMGRQKAILIDSILPFGFELLLCDTDMVWLKNPLPYLACYPEADILTSSDQLAPTVVDDKLEIWPQASDAFNIGMFHWRPTEVAKRLAKEWKDKVLADEQIWDQVAFNDLVRKKIGRQVEGDGELVYAFDGSLKLGILPSTIFCTGHPYFVQASYQQLRLEPYAVHATYQFGGINAKKHSMREAMLFKDPPEYYDPPGGFLSFKPAIPRALFYPERRTVRSHFALVNYQLKQIRTAFAIASLLN